MTVTWNTCWKIIWQPALSAPSIYKAAIWLADITLMGFSIWLRFGVSRRLKDGKTIWQPALLAISIYGTLLIRPPRRVHIAISAWTSQSTNSSSEHFASDLMLLKAAWCTMMWIKSSHYISTFLGSIWSIWHRYSIRIHLISLSYQILVILPSHFSTLEQML